VAAAVFETAVDAAAAGVAAAAGDASLRLDRCSYWELRPMVQEIDRAVASPQPSERANSTAFQIWPR
jgi:hypothetical protein